MLIKWGFKCHQFSPQNLCLQMSVLIIHWHCVHVHNFSIKLICIQYYPRLLSEEISEVC